MSQVRSQALLAQAHHEAQRATWLFTAPNPRVGALALAQGHVIGRGHHQVWGGAHAEEQALRDAGAWDEARDAPIPGRVDEMVVTLEPCSATGKKRVPCSQRLQEAGVRRITVGALDPDPRHAGKGLELLRSAGIEVHVAESPVWGERFVELNPAFLAGLKHAQRPWVLAKWASSVDGKVAADGGESMWISGPSSRAEVHRLRACSDAVLCGAGTFRRDDPSLTARPDEGPPHLQTAAAERQPLRVILGGGAEATAEAQIFRDPAPRLWILREGEEASAAVQAAGDAVCFAGATLTETLADVQRSFGVRRLFVEGGPTVHGSLLAEQCLDAIVRYEAPILLGGAVAAVRGPSCDHPAHAVRLFAEERKEHDADLRRAFLLQHLEGTPR